MLVLDLAGTFAFAASGALLAARRGFDIVGSLMLASLVGLGGGVVRDLVIGQLPTAFDLPVYLAAPVAAAALVYLRVLREGRLRRTLIVFDAAGLSLFCVTGTLKAAEAGLNPVAAGLLGLTTAVGGGVMRDVVANEVPQLFNPRGVYAVPAMLGAALTAGLEAAGWMPWPAGLAVAVLVFGIRVLSLRYGWRVPLAARGPAESGPHRS